MGREALRQDSQKRVRYIPPTREAAKILESVDRKRVCAYCRVSRDQADQLSSYQLQIEYYTNLITQNPSWQFCGVYADWGISGTSVKQRTNFIKMIKACKGGKIDYIITKSISRFARNTFDCLNCVRALKALKHPVGIYFEKERIDTLDSSSELLLSILSSLAQDESRNISENIRWGRQKLYQQGKIYCRATYLLGYDLDEQKRLVINENQAVVVRRIYREFLNGDPLKKIAQGLTEDGIKTAKGYSVWKSNTVYQILRNEKYCGDVLTHKRFVSDYLTHKIEVNKGQRPQFYMADHHPAIILREDWDLVQSRLDRRSRK